MNDVILGNVPAGHANVLYISKQDADSNNLMGAAARYYERGGQGVIDCLGGTREGDKIKALYACGINLKGMIKKTKNGNWYLDWHGEHANTDAGRSGPTNTRYESQAFRESFHESFINDPDLEQDEFDFGDAYVVERYMNGKDTGIYDYEEPNEMLYDYLNWK